MLFETEKERLAHPLWGKIPPQLWEKYGFNNMSLESALAMESLITDIEQGHDEFHFHLADEFRLAKDYCETYPDNKKQVFLAIASIRTALLNFDFKDTVIPSTASNMAHLAEFLGLCDDFPLDPDSLMKNPTPFYNLIVGNENMQRIYSLSDLSSNQFKSNFLHALDVAVALGNFPMFTYLMGLLEDKKFSDFKNEFYLDGLSYDVVRSASRNGHIALVSRILDLTKNARRYMTVDGFEGGVYFMKSPSVSFLLKAAFREALENNNLAVVTSLIKYAQESNFPIIKLLKRECFSSFPKIAADNRRALMMACWEDKNISTEEKMEKWTKIKDLSDSQLIAESDEGKILEYLSTAFMDTIIIPLLEKHNPNAHLFDYVDRGDLTDEDGYPAFYFHVTSLLDSNAPLSSEHLESIRLLFAIPDVHYFALYWASKEGDLSHFMQILKLVEDNGVSASDVLSSNNFTAFRIACAKGHLWMVKDLVAFAEKHDVSVVDMLVESFYAFYVALENGHLPIVDYLLEFAEEYEIPAADMPDHLAFPTFAKASSSGHTKLTQYLLNSPEVFAHAEQHYQEQRGRYGEAVLDFINTKVEGLQDRFDVFQIEHPNGVFDLTEADGDPALYHYMLRHLIRLNNAEHLDKIIFLLSIPTVHYQAAAEVTPGVPNELYRLAVRIGNADAAEILMNIPAVLEDVERNNHYQAEAHGDLDLRALAQDRESSMRALSVAEQKRFSRLEARYRHKVEEVGVPTIMLGLRETLRERYENNPAVITRENGEELELPFDWSEFERMDLTPKERQTASEAYYQDKNHTAYYYLSKPNPRMHPNASYVYVNEDRTEQWSTFEEYEPLIARLFLAANDESIGEIDGYTPKTRVTGFIDELAMIARAHNWDKSYYLEDVWEEDVSAGELVKVHSKGDEVLDGNPGRYATEERDDRKRDKPSCFSGVSKRLRQGLRAHPDLMVLTEDTIRQELRGFIWEHFKTVITPDIIEEVKNAWDEKYINMVETDAEKNREVLRSINISPDIIERFKENLNKKYGEEDLVGFKRQISNAFLADEEGLQITSLTKLTNGLDSVLNALTKEYAASAEQQPSVARHRNSLYREGSGGGSSRQRPDSPEGSQEKPDSPRHS